jgi:hypothetical protein
VPPEPPPPPGEELPHPRANSAATTAIVRIMWRLSPNARARASVTSGLLGSSNQ